jgi:hypothetical protein
MDIFIVVYSNGNRRVRATDPVTAWTQTCPNKRNVKFKPINSNSNKLLVLENNVQIGQVTYISRGRGRGSS